MTERRLRRVGHKGADLIVPGNTLASFDAALEVGVDMIEFDVLPEQPDDSRAARQSEAGSRARRRREREGKRLLLAHDYRDAAKRSPSTLDEGLAHLAGDAFAGIDLDIDLKLPGYELRVLDALRAHGMLERALISTQYRSSLTAIRAAEPDVRLGWTVPKLSRDPFRSVATRVPAYLALQAFRVALPSLAARAIRSGFCDAIMAHWRLVTGRLVRAVEGAGGELYVWTVDELPRLRALDALGVTGVITNDPRLFAALAG
jgi:glycerophosphoryl diester phosphodiesterase